MSPIPPVELPSQDFAVRGESLSGIRKGSGHPKVREYAEVLLTIVAVTAVGRFVPLGYPAFGHIYLLAVVALGLRVGRGPILFAALASAVAWDFFFVSPRMSFAVLDFDDALLLGVYLAVALISGQLTTYVREHEKLSAEALLQRTLLDSVSHELKTPLAILRAAADQLGTAGPAEREGLTTEIAEATGRLQHLVANLLNQTRLESGTLKPQLDWCDARDLINAARKAVEGPLAGRALEVKIEQDLPLLMADAHLMEHAISNLLLNASLHTPPGTPILIEAAAKDGDRRVSISVSDRGPGLPPELKAALFQKFRRGAAAHPGGLGLGLSIVRGFVVAQGGEVVAGENPGGGARFTLSLPSGRPAAAPNE